MKNIEMYTRGSQNHEDNSGKYALLLVYKDKFKLIQHKLNEIVSMENQNYLKKELRKI